MSNAPTRLLLVEMVDGITVVNFTDPALTSEEVVHQLDEQLVSLIEQAGVSKLLLSFREVRSMSSAVLGVLVKLGKKLTKSGGGLRLCALAPSLREIFRVTRLDRVLKIDDDEATAIDSF